MDSLFWHAIHLIVNPFVPSELAIWLPLVSICPSASVVAENAAFEVEVDACQLVEEGLEP